MLDKLKTITDRYEALTSQLEDPATYADPGLLRRLTREQKDALRKFSETLKEHNYKDRKSFFEKFKK